MNPVISGPELRAERDRWYLTQAQVAEKMGVDRTIISRYEGKARVRPTWARRYRDAISEIVSATENGAA